MKGGKIIVEGRGARRVGERMEGGEIIIKGDCKGYVGKEMKRIHPIIIPLDELRRR